MKNVQRHLPYSYDCTAPWYVAVGVLAVIGQPSKQEALVTHKSEAVSNPGAGKRAGPRRPGFQLLPKPASSLRHRRAKYSLFSFKAALTTCLLRM